MEDISLPRILYIDDQPTARLLVRRLCARQFIFLEAGTGLSGIKLAQGSQPDLVLIDINLPDLSGWEVAERLSACLPGTPLVALTADSTPGARRHAQAAGFAGYISKPVDIETFSEEIKDYLAGKRAHWPTG